MSRTGVIYEIRFDNGKSYIGQTINLKKRKLSHEWHKDKSDLLVYKVMRKHNYEWIILEEVCETLLDDKERYYIELKNTFINGYNLNKGGKRTIKSHRYTYEDFYNSAIKYESKKEWRESEDKRLYNSCKKNYSEIYKKVTQHMKRPENKNKISDKRILEIAHKYEYLNDFRKNDFTIYSIAHKRGLLKDINLKRLRNKSQYYDLEE